MTVLTYPEFKRLADELSINLFMSDYPVVNIDDSSSIRINPEERCTFLPDSPNNSHAQIYIYFLSSEHARTFQEVFTEHGLFREDITASTWGATRALNWSVSLGDGFTKENIQAACQFLTDRLNPANANATPAEGQMGPVDLNAPHHRITHPPVARAVSRASTTGSVVVNAAASTPITAEVLTQPDPPKCIVS